VARFYPNRPRPDITAGERLVFDRLKDLDDSWFVLHHVTFVGQERRGHRPGEADFVLLNARVGLIILEVKDGIYEVAGRSWYAVRRGNRELLARTPFDQAVDNRYKLSQWIKATTGVRVPNGHCVVFTHGRPNGQLGPDAPPAITLTGQSLANSRLAIATVVEHWRRAPWEPSPADFEKVLEALVPDVSIAPTLDYMIDMAGADLERLTNHQIRLTHQQLDVVSATSTDRACLVLGAAGTGKTLLAMHRAQTVAKSGAHVALVCDQKHLRLELRGKLHIQADIGDPWDLLRGLFIAAGLTVAYPAEESWEAALRLAEATGPMLDCLIVDEAQSHDPVLLDALRELVRPDGATILFADPYQRDFTGTWRPPGPYHEYWLTENCRNTLPIARLVARLGGAMPPVAGAEGPTPRFVQAGEQGQKVAVEVIKDLATQIPPTRIVVLTRTGGHQALRVALGRAGLPLGTAKGNDGLLICSVDDFRGCEAAVLVYVADDQAEQDRTLDYIATSRACSHLSVVGRPEQWKDQLYLLEEST
jgi:hypothetical protein